MAKAKSEFEPRLKELLAHTEAIAGTGATHKELWNAVFGIGARYGQLFPTLEERQAIANEPTLKKIQAIVSSAPRPEPNESEKTGKLLLRMPKSLHNALADEAEAEGVSLNQLILTKLAVTLAQAVHR